MRQAPCFLLYLPFLEFAGKVELRGVECPDMTVTVILAASAVNKSM